MPITTVLFTPLPTAAQQAQARTTLQMIGPRLNVEIGLPDILAQQLAASQQPLLPPIVGYGLVDSGASNTAIDDAAAIQLGLQVIDQIHVMTPAGRVPQSVYAAKISFPGHPLLAIPFLGVAGAQLANQGLVALIGRDFLAGKTFLYDGLLNSFTISW